MIPAIEKIIEGLLSGEYTKQQAIGWLHMHAENAARELRDDFAAFAMQGYLASYNSVHKLPPADHAATWAYAYADAMLRERDKEES